MAYFSQLLTFGEFEEITANTTGTTYAVSWRTNPDPDAVIMMHAASSQTGTGSILYYLEISPDNVTWSALPTDGGTDSTDTAVLWFNDMPAAKYIRVRGVVTGDVVASSVWKMVTSAPIVLTAVA